MAIELNVRGNSNININTATDSADVQTSGAKSSSKILNGDSLTVLSGAMSDLEKLVALLKSETDDTTMSVTQQRISILQTVLNTMSDRVSESERKSLIEIENLNGQKSDLQTTLKGYESEKAATQGRIAALDVQIAALERAIEQAVRDGEDHREKVAELKKQRDEERAKLDQIETSIKSVNSKISGIDVKIAEYTKTIAQTTLNEVANALRIAASDKEASSSFVNELSDASNADRVKKDAKEAATDIGNIIRDALNKIDDQMRKTLDEAQVVKA